MLILDEGVWIKFEDNGELKDGIIKRAFLSGCCKPFAYDVFCKNHMNVPITISVNLIKFVRLNDLDGKTYYANYRLLDENTIPLAKKHINKATVFRKEFYNKLCMHDCCDDHVYYSDYIRHDENALNGAINKMYGILTKDLNYNPLDYTKYNPKHVLLNGRYTTVVWEDGSHTVVKLAKGEEYDPEKAILYAIIKHMNGDVKAETDRYLNRFIDRTIYQSQSKKEFLKELDKRDAAGDICQEYNPDEETFFDDEEDGDDTE